MLDIKDNYILLIQDFLYGSSLMFQKH